ncbi:hypothetical protein TNCV_3857961 [Trichonephila clavipes]|nr:hypothetical protein TNCV_3857961 [Trichonephila clavipes]
MHCIGEKRKGALGPWVVYWLEHRTPDRKAWVEGAMPPNTLRVHTEYVFVKSVGSKVLWTVAAETPSAEGCVAREAKGGPRNNFQDAGAECTFDDYFQKETDSQLGGGKRRTTKDQQRIQDQQHMQHQQHIQDRSSKHADCDKEEFLPIGVASVKRKLLPTRHLKEFSGEGEATFYSKFTASEFGMPQKTVWKILRKELNCHMHHLQLTQQTTEDDM